MGGSFGFVPLPLNIPLPILPCRSAIHGRGLFCKRNIDAGEMVIEYSGIVIRSVLTDKREKFYDGKVGTVRPEGRVRAALGNSAPDHFTSSLPVGHRVLYVPHG